MHEAVEAFSEANDQDRREAQEITDQLQQAEANGYTLMNDKALRSRLDRLRARVTESDAWLTSYETAESEADTATLAAMVVMAQLLLATKKEVDDSWAEVAEKHAQIEVLRERVEQLSEDEESPPDLA